MAHIFSVLWLYLSSPDSDQDEGEDALGEESDGGSCQVDTYEEEEEELTDLEGEDDLSVEEDSRGIRDPLTCVQRAERSLVVHVPAGETKDLIADENDGSSAATGGGGGNVKQVWRLKLPTREKPSKGVPESSSFSTNTASDIAEIDEKPLTRDSGQGGVSQFLHCGVADREQKLTHLSLSPPPVHHSPSPSPSPSSPAREIRTHGQVTAASYTSSPPPSSPSPALTPSLFPGVPPTIHFPLPDEDCECQWTFLR